MKNYFTLFVLIFFFSALNAQVLPNAGFEIWEDMGSGETVDEPQKLPAIHRLRISGSPEFRSFR